MRMKLIHFHLVVYIFHVTGVSCDLSFTILHNNDLYSRFDEIENDGDPCKTEQRPLKCLAGFARISRAIQKFRRAAESGGPPVLYFNAGNTFIGTNWFTVHGANICVDFMNVLKPDALTVGHHEFDRGMEGLEPYITGLKSPFVVSNIDTSDCPAGLHNIKKSHVLSVNGVKVGIVGYLTPRTREISNPEKVIFHKEIEALRKETEKLKKAGVKIIIALGHSGIDMDKVIGKEVPLIDLIIGGMTKTFLWNGRAPDVDKPVGPYPATVDQPNFKTVPILHAFAYGKYLGCLNVTFDDEGNLIDYEGQPIFLSRSSHLDLDVVNKLQKYRPAVEAVQKDIIGSSRVKLDGDRRICTYRECNMGNLITDAFIDYKVRQSPAKYWTKTPIGIINGGSIMAGIDTYANNGSISRGDLLLAQPYNGIIFEFSLLGKHLMATLEHSSRGGRNREGFLQVSGIHVKYSRNRFKNGSRLIHATVRCSECSVPTYNEIQPEETYRLLSTSFLLNGGDGHWTLRTKAYNRWPIGVNDISIISDYIKTHSPVQAEIEERIMIVPYEENSTPSNKRQHILHVIFPIMFTIY